jgi:hypothetical protein
MQKFLGMQITNRRVRIYRQDMPEACPYSKCVGADAFGIRVHSCDSWARKRNAVVRRATLSLRRQSLPIVRMMNPISQRQHKKRKEQTASHDENLVTNGISRPHLPSLLGSLTL